jgi:O-antigen/teichoic acid export membrane protein
VRSTFRRLAAHGLGHSSAWLLGGAIVTRAATLGASIAVARIISPADFGRVTLMQTSVTLLSGLAGFGLTLAITRQVAEARTDEPAVAGAYLGSAVVFTLIGATAVTGIFIAGRTVFASALLDDSGLTTLITAAAGAIAFTAINAAIQAALLGLEAFRSMALAQWLQGLGIVGGLVVGAAEHGPTGSLAGFSIGQAAASVAAWYVLRRETRRQQIPVSYGLKRPELFRLWRVGLPTFAAFLAVATSLLTALVILGHHDSYSEVGLFTTAYRWHLVILFVPAAIVPALVPLMTRLQGRARRETMASLFGDSMRATLVLAAGPAVVIALTAPLLLGLSGHFYETHPWPLVILAAASIPTALNNVLSNTSVGLGEMRAWLVSDLVLGAVLVGAAAGLVGAGLGATGLALAYLAGYVGTDLALAGPLVRRLRVSPVEV